MPTESPLIRALLRNSACYDHAVTRLELVETHISWVILTGKFAYKIKKPVNLGFLDFSTLDLRRQDCIEELRLNRRLAADYYLGVVAINGTADAPHISSCGEVLEYAVKMQQFSPDATLDKLAIRGELTESHIDALAARIAHFHATECEAASADSPWGEPATIALPVAENFQILMSRLTDATEIQLLARLKNWSEDELARLTPLMRERKRGGWVRECHGDLHLANVAWAGGKPVIFDCLEFSPALRWIDIVSEIAFCYMDLLHRHEPALAARFLNAWLETTGDYAGVALLRYYAVYRALVRAKVAALRLGQVTDALALQNARIEVSAYLQLAQQLSVPAAPQLWITHGLSGSGKTTLSQKLLQQHGMIRLRSDVERKRLAGMDAEIHSGINAGLYAADFSRRTYQHLARLAEVLLKAGHQVIVDAAFLERQQRDLFRELALKLGADFKILAIQANPDTLRQRVMLRSIQGHDASDADLPVLEHQLNSALPLDTDELPLTVSITG